MKKIMIFQISLIFFTSSFSQIIHTSVSDSICGHPVYKDINGSILSWYKPYIPGAAYAEVVKLAAEFIRFNVPIESTTGLKLYFISCCFQGPHMRSQQEFDSGKTWEEWMNNPACTFAGLTQSLAVNYFPFTGDDGYLDVVREMLDYELAHGTTPGDWLWPNVPYASADPMATLYQGATKWENEGMRGDGLHGIEPDKIGELGIAYLNFYEITLDEKYLLAAINCADVLAKHVRNVTPDPSPFASTETVKSPWPFRVNARTGVVISEYCANVIEPIRLFDELLRIKERINSTPAQNKAWQNARTLAWDWLYSKNGPMKTFSWNAYFEDIPNDPDRSNRNQVSPMETARYLLKHPELDPGLDVNVPALIHWTASVFSTEGMNAIKEQTWCYEPMGSHTSRYAGICALEYERTGDEWYKEQAFRFFNLATYMTYENGVVAVGPKWPGSWFSDGYGDYIRHFMEGIGAIPEWAPANENHILKSTSIIQSIAYDKKNIQIETFDCESVITARLVKKPSSIYVNDKIIKESKNIQTDRWNWKPLDKGGVLLITIGNGNRITIKL